MVNGSFELNLAERIESLKAGILAALGVCVAFAAIALVNSQVLAARFANLASLQITRIDANLLISGAIAAKATQTAKAAKTPALSDSMRSAKFSSKDPLTMRNCAQSSRRDCIRLSGPAAKFATNCQSLGQVSWRLK